MTPMCDSTTGTPNRPRCGCVCRPRRWCDWYTDGWTRRTPRSSRSKAMVPRSTSCDRSSPDSDLEGLTRLTMDDPYDLERFVAAQNDGSTYDRALAELRHGRKASHWMWYVFPRSPASDRARRRGATRSSSLAEAKAFLEHPVLGPRLIEAAGIVSHTQGRSAEQIFGSIDAQKLRSSMTLFLRAAPDRGRFSQVLERYFDGQPDPATDHAPVSPRQGTPSAQTLTRWRHWVIMRTHVRLALGPGRGAL